ncbi:transcription regulator rrf2-type conserved site [Lucifera butyrica]|uniref:Transcription regulator rrf2-type conserved site n=1 Tax=Lucifera butyrica TaxID=1351585 RepID=A0A498R7B1_9FIRM|nr:Rrf2 family transcriptional regulator [Lucifera butyrica]VBB05018.1 transcription regulator rrf2-type conserved site [Lucifera butyrica]
MQLNQATDYAFRVILFLAAQPAGEVISGQRLAEEQCIPQGFLQKVTRPLVQAGLLQSWRGVEGGFSLARPAQEISLLDVIQAMEGEIAIHRCLAEKSACSRGCVPECPVHQALGKIQEEFTASLSKIHFATLAGESENTKAGGKEKAWVKCC